MIDLRIAISSCPNDTFCFQPWIEECIHTSFRADFFFNDVDTLNRVAMASAPFDVTKLSAACLGAVSDRYEPLSSGAAFAINGGPKVLAKAPLSVSDFSELRLAIPGKMTSAYAAYSLLFGCPAEVLEMSPSSIIRAILDGTCDAGLVIHETGSVASRYGLIEAVDVGEAYRSRFGFPLPLGVIVAKRSLGPSMIQELDSTLSRSICEAKARAILSSFVREKAQELDSAILWQHIHQYVTAETECMTPQARQWLAVFTQLLTEEHEAPCHLCNAS
jgi:1,4-dihydroxy-6-naphthoate synthase